MSGKEAVRIVLAIAVASVRIATTAVMAVVALKTWNTLLRIVTITRKACGEYGKGNGKANGIFAQD